jgi:predicted methyltransferase
MRSNVLKAVSPAILFLLAACGDSPPPQPNAPTPAPKATDTQPTSATTVAPTATTPPKPPEPTAEEKKKAEDLKALEADRAEWNTKHAAEVARWTPDMHKAAKDLADKTYPSGKAAIQAMVAGKHRAPGAADRDKYRHPTETLEFFGFKPTMTVLDIGPGEGWYTELLAPALAKQGKYFATNGDPKGPADQRGTFYAQRFVSFLETAPEIYGKVETVTVDGKAPKIGKDNTFDMVLIMRGIHGMINNKTFHTWLDEISKSLKNGGVLGIEEHRAKADANVEEAAKKGYVPEAYILESAEKHGFKLAGKNEINANPKDTKDYAEGVWTLPPTYRLKDKDKEKYAAIGESDRMTLKFVKVATPGPAPAKP